VKRILTLALVVLTALAAGCASLPSLEGRKATTAVTDTADTRLGRALAPQLAAHPGKTGIHAVPDAHDAFAARVLFAAAADRSLDIQYFIWNSDEVGDLLLEALWVAAARGVRVRMLLDDLNTGGRDATLAAFAAHPNVEVRLYNPLLIRDARVLNFVTDFTRVNRRMHNKSFTIDNQVSIVGGRNIANEYFGAGSGIVFADLDVIAVGEAVGGVSREFDLYWNSASAYPAHSVLPPAGPDATAELEARFGAVRADPDSAGYLEAVRATPLVRAILERRLDFEWTTATVVYDDPAKTLDSSDRTDILLLPQLIANAGPAQRALDLVSPYFVPGDDGTATLIALAQRGIKVRILTNSLASSDESAVHAGYAKRRLPLLRGGVELYELKPTAGRETREGSARLGRSSSSGLHAKTFAVDGQRIFVGSFNFDQRSARLNTEMGLVIDSPVLAGRLAGFFESLVPQIAYTLRLTPGGEGIEWIERTPAGERRFETDPETSWSLRMKVDLLSILPIEWLL